MSAPTSTPVDPNATKNYASPDRLCDIVMKGGITSGVVYPSAVSELAVAYSFKNIGGASAGAIAAAATAAAEYRRRKGHAPHATRKAGFERLEELPRELATSLSTLFQSNKVTEPLFNLLNASLDLGKQLPVTEKGMTLARAVALNFPRGAGLGMLPGLFLIAVIGGAALWVGLTAPDRTALWWFGFVALFGTGLLFSVLLTLLFRTAGAVINLFTHAASALPENNFGLCNGMKDIPSRHKPLTEWLADELDQIAGKTDPREPLTFADLKGASSPLEDGLPREEKGINLEMMTTNLTLGRPYRLPSFGGSREFFFDPAELRRLFPARVVAWMEMKSNELEPKSKKQAAEWASFSPRLPLPRHDDLPVVVATRMSLSYPVLLSAVPLYMVDRTAGTRAEAPAPGGDAKAAAAAADDPRSEAANRSEAHLEKCWFSDGGICSNFPIHLFDGPLPRWPTFGINLRPVNPAYHHEGQPESEKVYLVKKNSDGLAPMWDRFDQKESGFGKVIGFFVAMVNTMYNWSDNLQTTVPGYRDRVVHIHLTEKEGGLNLNMTEETITSLGERGACAGRKLRARFTGQEAESHLSWDTHRWTRYRTTMSLLEKMLRDLKRAYHYARHGDASYAELVVPPPNHAPLGVYEMKDERQRPFALAATQQLITEVDGWKSSAGQTFRDENVPHPEPEFRIRPNV